MDYYRLRILHLSDLHERGPDREREPWRRRRVLGSAWEANLDELRRDGPCRRRLAESVDLLLRGHLHEPESFQWVDPVRRLPQLAAGCLYEGHRADQWPNACQMLDLELDQDGRPRRYELRFRGWSARGHWFDDNSLYPDSQKGRLALWVGAEPTAGEAHPQNISKY